MRVRGKDEVNQTDGFPLLAHLFQRKIRLECVGLQIDLCVNMIRSKKSIVFEFRLD